MNYEIFSMGTKPIFDKLQPLIENNQVDTIFLNLNTIIRNCVAREEVKQAIDFDKQMPNIDRSTKILYEESKKEMINFIQYVCQLLNNNSTLQKPKFVSYHADYSKCIPQELYRTPPASKQLLHAVSDLVKNKLITGDRKDTTVGNVTLVELPITDKHCPWRHLLQELKITKTNHNVAVISSHPTDYHFGLHCRTFNIIRSYTGEVVPYKQLGNVVFNVNGTIPFNVYTHALLGDKEDVKATLTGKAKTNLIDIATKEEWTLKTQEYIHDRLYQLGIRIPTTF